MKKILFLLFLIPTLIAGQKCIKGNCTNGQGTCTYSYGKYVGEWKDGDKNGQGVFTYSNGNKYVGEWKDGDKNGQGTFAWADGAKYVGEWKDDLRNGQGVFTYSNGNKYVGEFKNGSQTGQGNSLRVDNADVREELTAIEFSRVYKKNYEETIKLFVEEKINKWQKKGEFEKTVDYQNRVNESKRNQMIEQFQKEALNAEKKKYAESFNSYSVFKLKAYDADNETFLLNSPQQGEMILNVPIDKAPSFKQNFPSLEYKNLEFVLANNKFILSSLKVFDKDGNVYTYNNKSQSTYAQTKIDYNFSDIEINIPNQSVKQNNIVKRTNNISVGKADVDMDIPINNKRNPHRYALIIGNEDYSSFQTGLSSEVNVDYAINDAKVFSEYCEKTLGVDSRHLKLLSNATYGQMSQAISWIQNLSKIEGGNAEIIFYYSGHGLPDEVTKEGYLMPVDISGNNVSRAIKLKDLYTQLNKYPAKEITVVLDACFSGGARNEGLVAMKGVKIKPKEDVVSGNMVVFASSSGNESSAVYREKQHGYLTYFLLKKIQETKGYVNYKDLSDYLDYQVRKETAIIGKVQTPKVNVSPSARDQWKYWSFR